MKIIVSRYNEDISWTFLFKNVIIYNKGVKLSSNSYSNLLNSDIIEIHLSNVGREGHTYYKYIYDNYDNLDDYTIFLQGNPFDHSPNIIKNLLQIQQDHENNQFNPINFTYLSEKIIHCNLSGCNHHRGIPLIPIYEYLFNEKKTNMNFIFGAGAQFMVSREQILSRPKDFYLKIIKLLDHNISPIEGYVIERFHQLILTNNTCYDRNVFYYHELNPPKPPKASLAAIGS